AKAADYPAAIVLVISNRPQAKGLELARAAGIATVVIDHNDFPTRAGFDAAIERELAAAKIELICLAGFLRVLTDNFVKHWFGRMLNIHPSLLPAFRGLDTHRRALQAGASKHGATVHFVQPELDTGPIVIQEEVPVLPDDTPA